MSSDPARAQILGRILNATDRVRDADPAARHAAMPRDYRTADDTWAPKSMAHAGPDESAGVASSDLLDRLEERLVDYGVTVVRTAADTLADTLRDHLDRRNVRRLVVPSDVPDAWRPGLEGRTHLADDAGTFELDEADATVTGCAVAIAETGTIVLDHGPGQGARAASLIPDVHFCVVYASQVVNLVPEAIERTKAAALDGAAFTWISGPSATSDIELVRVAGVHGPRTLIVLLVTDA